MLTFEAALTQSGLSQAPRQCWVQTGPVSLKLVPIGRTWLSQDLLLMTIFWSSAGGNVGCPARPHFRHSPGSEAPATGQQHKHQRL